MRVVVFGSTGMVGRAVIAKLSRSPDFNPVAVSRQNNGFDVRSSAERASLLLRDAEVAINCVGLLRGSPSYGAPAFRYEATLVNALWPQRLAALASDVGCRVIHLSTDAVFAPGPEAAREDTPLSPTEVYGISKALGEVDADHVLNLRFSVIGPAPDRGPSLWEWLVGQSPGAIIQGHATFGWTGCTSVQLAALVSDLLPPVTFNAVRSRGSALHFLPNGTATKFSVLKLLAERVRPDVCVIPATQDAPTSRILASCSPVGAAAYSGTQGWSAAIDEMV